MKIVDNWFSNEYKMNIIKKLGKNNENKVENLNGRKNSF